MAAYNGMSGCQTSGRPRPWLSTQPGFGRLLGSHRIYAGRSGDRPIPLRIKNGQIHMYLQEVLGQQRHKEWLQEAQRSRVVSQIRALNREQRRLVRAQRQMNRAHARARRIRLELEAGS